MIGNYLDIIMMGYLRLLIACFVPCLGVWVLDVYCFTRWYNMDRYVLTSGDMKIGVEFAGGLGVESLEEMGGRG
jgi:hypothetical protein